jgi:hypothetical protein
LRRISRQTTITFNNKKNYKELKTDPKQQQIMGKREPDFQKCHIIIIKLLVSTNHHKTYKIIGKHDSFKGTM